MSITACTSSGAISMHALQMLVVLACFRTAFIRKASQTCAIHNLKHYPRVCVLLVHGQASLAETKTSISLCKSKLPARIIPRELSIELYSTRAFAVHSTGKIARLSRFAAHENRTKQTLAVASRGLNTSILRYRLYDSIRWCVSLSLCGFIG
jgi:hypothetical protein